MDMASEMYKDDWDIAGTLDRDVSGRMFREIVDVLEQRRRAFQRELDKGVTPDEFKRGEVLLSGFEAAVKGLEKAHQKRHGQA